ncbi:hypothetical protein PR202_gb19968 [Eleusine coracana subsp. coracana]|uniref:Major facilitator superfamily (MFS) profile domain-containing protein n=1 Tax=Eleusine coracana subsp. coracana TaxID=191504 RepID=A0AAV5F9I2_ELECO|nr:hypothetical protein PR202_gb19968 [Eleusine coracana subsp. coracana]
MAVTLTSCATASALLLLPRRSCDASSVCRSRRWQRAASRRDDSGPRLELPGERWPPPAAADDGKRTRRVDTAAAVGDAPYGGSKGQGSLWMVFLSTAVAVWGSFEFGTCVGYSAPTQARIMSDIGLSNSQVPVFISEIAPKDIRGGLTTSNQVSSSGTFLGCFLTGLSFYFKVYYAAYSVGMGPVPWVIMSEIFSIDMKAIAGSLVTLFSWIGSFGISYSFTFLMDWNPAGTFFLFSAASLVTVLFVARLVPETKGRTLEEIQVLLKAST